MNILIDLLPVKVVINGTEYAINSDFRTSILFSILMDDSRLNEDMKVMQALTLYYPVIPNIQYRKEAIEKIMWFYRCGKEKDTTARKGKGNNKRILDYEVDADYIYSAFMSQYKIDLQDINYLHWWKFKSLLDSMNEDNRLFKIIQYRSIDLNGIKDKEQKRFYKEMQKRYSLDNNLSKEELNQLEEWNKKLG